MKNIRQFILGITILTCSCGQSSQDTSANKDNKQVLKQDTSKSNSEVSKHGYSNNWTDSLIRDYVFHTKSELVRLAVNNKISEECFFDQMVDKDTTKYYSFQIGHDITDEGKTNPRFVTDQWIYIDSITHQLYEYDIANDSLVRWTK